MVWGLKSNLLYNKIKIVKEEERAKSPLSLVILNKLIHPYPQRMQLKRRLKECYFDCFSETVKSYQINH